MLMHGVLRLCSATLGSVMELETWEYMVESARDIGEVIEVTCRCSATQSEPWNEGRVVRMRYDPENDETSYRYLDN